MTKGEQDVALDVGDPRLAQATVLGMKSPEEGTVKPGIGRQVAQVLTDQLAEAADGRAQVPAPLRLQHRVGFDPEQHLGQGQLIGGGEGVAAASVRHGRLHNRHYTWTRMDK